MLYTSASLVIVVDSSVWIDFFNGVSTPEVEHLGVGAA